MPKCDFNKIALWHGCSPVNLLHVFRKPFPRNNSRQLLLERVKNQRTKKTPATKSN